MDRKRLLVLLAVAGWLVLAAGLTCAPYAIASDSMAPTIRAMDRVLVVKHFLQGPVQRGDLVTMVYPPDPKQTFVKRVLGVPGDRIRIVNKQLYLNGKAVAEPYVQHATTYFDSFRDNFPSEPNMHVADAARRMLKHDVHGGEVIVPAGNYFVLGDNRDESLDSRYWGFLPAENVVGRPVYIYSGHPGPLHRVALQ